MTVAEKVAVLVREYPVAVLESEESFHTVDRILRPDDLEDMLAGFETRAGGIGVSAVRSVSAEQKKKHIFRFEEWVDRPAAVASRLAALPHPSLFLGPTPFSSAPRPHARGPSRGRLAPAGRGTNGSRAALATCRMRSRSSSRSRCSIAGS